MFKISVVSLVLQLFQVQTIEEKILMILEENNFISLDSYGLNEPRKNLFFRDAQNRIIIFSVVKGSKNSQWCVDLIQSYNFKKKSAQFADVFEKLNENEDIHKEWKDWNVLYFSVNKNRIDLFFFHHSWNRYSILEDTSTSFDKEKFQDCMVDSLLKKINNESCFY